MNMKYFEVKKLLEAVETKIGKKPKAASDFETLASEVWNKCEEHLAPLALKRLWGFFTNMEKPKPKTLDTLSLFVGFQDWDSFKSALSGESDARLNYHGENIISEDDLSKNDIVDLFWKPDGHCAIKYLGKKKFSVISSDSPSLSVDDSFECSFFQNGKDLHLKNLQHGGTSMSDSVISSDGGITVKVRDK